MDRLPAKFLTITGFLFASLQACNNVVRNDQIGLKSQAEERSSRKPPSSYNNSLEIPPLSAVFFEPDSIQLEKIKAVTDDHVFKGSMHEYAYQIKNGHFFLKRYWPQVKIFVTKKARFLVFQHANKSTDSIDLDKNDPCGMYVFDGVKKPLLVDMTNIETQVPDYFSSNTKGGATMLK
jgi:hypothetical protein